MKTKFFILNNAIKKTLIVLLMGSITLGAFATLGETSNKGKDRSKRSILSAKSQAPGVFSLRSGYNFRGSQVIDVKENKYINLNTVITYQEGNTTYTVPIKKKVILNNRVTFNPNAATR